MRRYVISIRRAICSFPNKKSKNASRVSKVDFNYNKRVMSQLTVICRYKNFVAECICEIKLVM